MQMMGRCTIRQNVAFVSFVFPSLSRAENAAVVSSHSTSMVAAAPGEPPWPWGMWFCSTQGHSNSLGRMSGSSGWTVSLLELA